MDIFLWIILIIALGKSQKDIIWMKQRKLIWNALKVVKLVQKKRKGITTIAWCVKKIIFYSIIQIASIAKMKINILIQSKTNVLI